MRTNDRKPSLESRDPFEGAEPQFTLKSGAGLVVLLAGMALGFGVIQMIFKLISSPDQLGILERLAGAAAEHRTMLVEGKSVELPRSVFGLGAYAAAVCLCAIAAGVAKSMINSGTTLLGGNLKQLVQKLTEVLGSSKRP